LCKQHSHIQQLFVLSRIPRLNILMEAYTLIQAGKFRCKLCFFSFLVKNRFYGSRLYYVVKYSMNKLGNIHSVMNLAHLFPFIKKKNPKDLERVWGIKHISLSFISPYVISTLRQIQGHYFIWQLKMSFLYLVSYTQHGHRNECLLCDWL